MAVLESCAKHNMVAYLEKTDGNTDFHEIIDFLTRSSIHYALTVSPVVSTTFVEQFWMSAKSKIINNVRYITAKVAGKPVTISEASIRSDLLFDDADGIDSSLHNQAIFDLYNNGGNVTPLFESILVQPTEDEGEASERQSKPQPTPSPPHQSAYQHETQPDPSSRPSPTIPIPDFISRWFWPQIRSLKKESKPVITHHKAWMKSVSIKQRLAGKKTLKKKWMQKESVSKQGRKPTKSKPTVYKDLAFDDLDDVDVNDAMDYMETDPYMQKGVSTEDQVSTVKPDKGTDKPDEDQVSIVKPDKGIDNPKVSTEKPEV
ncbi:hypothetical protein Tco_1189797, partial [Tanacetum coccineum]